MPESILAQFRQECVHLLEQSFARIEHCVQQLTFDQLWWSSGPGQNSIGILLRHVSGNLRQWAVDGVLGKADNRDRDSEFAAAPVETAQQLLGQLRLVIAEVRRVLESLEPSDLLESRRIQGFDVTLMGAYMHTIPHIVGHTHQIVTLTRMQLAASYQFHWDSSAPRGSVPL